MHPLESAIRLAEFAGQNIAYNLEFFPADKLNWKPEPTAKSALEIVHHVSAFLNGMGSMLAGGEFTIAEPPAPTDLASAQALIRTATGVYVQAALGVDPARLGETVELPFGTFPFARAATMPAFDLIHHHGQIAYLQTLLGDEESHFEGM